MTEDQPPLTDEELEILARYARVETFSLNDGVALYALLHGEAVQVPCDVLGRLVAEVRRPRADEWLEEAAEEIAQDSAVGTLVRSGVLASLRKYRDGKA